MKRLVMIAATLLVASSSFAASPPQNASINVTATNGGVFNFTIAAATYAFGTVDASGTLNIAGTQPITGVRNGGNTGATYTTSTATTWSLASAPARASHIFNASTGGGATSITWGISDRLEISTPATGVAGATSCGFKLYTANTDPGAGACGGGGLIHSFTAGNGANSVTGNLDFRLTVLDVDATGNNTWTVVLTATAP